MVDNHSFVKRDTLNSEIHSLHGLRKFIKDSVFLPEHTEILAQVVDQQGQGWLMKAEIGEIPGSTPTKLVIRLSHPQLTKLPDMEQQEDYPVLDRLP